MGNTTGAPDYDADALVVKTEVADDSGSRVGRDDSTEKYAAQVSDMHAEQVLPHNSPTVLGGVFAYLSRSPTTVYDTVAEQQEDDFVHLDPSNIPPQTQKTPGDLHPEVHFSDQSSDGSVNHDLVAPRSPGDQNVSAHLDPTDPSASWRASIAEQAREHFSGFCATGTVPPEQNSPGMDFKDQCDMVDAKYVLPPATPESGKPLTRLHRHPPSICAGHRREHLGIDTVQLRYSQLILESWHQTPPGTDFDDQFSVRSRVSQHELSATPYIGQTDSAHPVALRSPKPVDEQRTEELPNPWGAEIRTRAISNGKSGHSGSVLTQTSAQALVSGDQKEAVDFYAPNIVIFGEAGVKKSIINLIADRKLARTSNGVRGCTFHHVQHRITLGKTPCTLWDTTGLDEGSQGTVPAKQAESNLKELMQELARTGGIHLVIYCIRGSRLTKALKRNYDLFYVAVCRKKIHVALVVTDLENQAGGMETWWTTNKQSLLRHGMWFDAHACVTTADIKDHAIQERRSESRRLLRELVIEHAWRSGWKSDPSFISRVLPLFQSVLTGISSTGSPTTTRKVTVCGSFSEFFAGTSAVWEKSTGRIGSRLVQIIRVDKRALDRVTSKILEDAGGMGAGVLVFYSSFLENNLIPSDDIRALKAFYDVAGGQIYPAIVVLRGCNDAQVAEACRAQVKWHHSNIDARFVSLPITKVAQAKLEDMIEHLYIEQVEVKMPRFFMKYLVGKHLFAAFGDGQ